eukprot:3183361-Pyramimonas_sp.AAC.1
MRVLTLGVLTLNLGLLIITLSTLIVYHPWRRADPSEEGEAHIPATPAGHMAGELMGAQGFLLNLEGTVYEYPPSPDGIGSRAGYIPSPLMGVAPGYLPADSPQREFAGSDLVGRGGLKRTQGS